MKIHEYNEMMSYLTRPAMAYGGRVGFYEGKLVKPGLWKIKFPTNTKLAEKYKGTKYGTKQEIRDLIKTAIPDAQITIQDVAGDNNHYSATIKSKVFSGKSKIEQHKLVYKALKGKMGNELHALALNTMEI